MADLNAAEAWFTSHGLPYFISRDHAAVEAALSRPRLVTLGTAALALSAVVGIVVGLLTGDASVGVLTGLVVTGMLVLVYAWTQLRMRTIARWALRRTLGSLGLMFPLLTRALPLLLLFITFLFINTEVWQVASDMDRGVLGIAVLLFAAIAAGFLLVRLPEEVRRVEEEVRHDRLTQCCQDTPLVAAAAKLPSGTGSAPLPRLQRANLVLVLLFSQAVQVLLLSLTVLAFFLVFGKVAISADVMESWLGHGPTDLAMLGDWSPVSNELFQVAVFLAAFAGLYFTVYAVTDATYREQFFTAISRELEQAIGVHTVYETLRRPQR
jgi:MFS family permease